MKVLVSFCLFGDDPDDIYYSGALRNADLYLRYHPSFSLVYYIATSCGKGISEELLKFPNVRVVEMDGPADQSATFWRFLSIREPSGYDYYLFRDVDSRPIKRERDVVAAWMKSGMRYNVIRDHAYHGVPMLAGLWGCNEIGANKIAHRIPQRLKQNFYGVDQTFLTMTIWPIAKRSVYAAIDGNGYRYGTAVHEIHGSLDEGFIGQGFYGDDLPRFPEHNRGKFKGIV